MTSLCYLVHVLLGLVHHGRFFNSSRFCAADCFGCVCWKPQVDDQYYRPPHASLLGAAMIEKLRLAAFAGRILRAGSFSQNGTRQAPGRSIDGDRKGIALQAIEMPARYRAHLSALRNAKDVVESPKGFPGRLTSVPGYLCRYVARQKDVSEER